MKIFVSKEGNVLGPYYPNEIRHRLGNDHFDGTELARREGMDSWVNVKELLEAEAKEITEQINKIKELISDGHTDTAWQHIQSLNNPYIYEGILKPSASDPEEFRLTGCPVNGTGKVWPPECFQEDVQLGDGLSKVVFTNGDLFLKLLVNHPERKLQQLQTLDLKNIQLTDVSPLKELTQLEWLYLQDNRIKDVSPLKELTKLEWLYLQDNRIKDVSPLKELTELRYLFLQDNPDLSKAQIDALQKALPNCTIEHDPPEESEVPSVVLGNNEYFLDNVREPLDEETLEQIAKIKGLVADGHPDKAQALVQELSHTRIYEELLKECGIEEEWVSSPEYLQERNGEFFIKLLANIPEEASLWPEIKQLTHLIFYPNQLTDVSPLKDLTQLKGLSVESNQLTDINALKGLAQLKTLLLSENDLTDVSPLQGLTQLEKLHLDRNRLTDVTPLQELTQLTELLLFKNRLTDVTSLKDLSQLQLLYLDANKLTDLTPLKDLTQLTELSLSDNPSLSKVQIDELQKALPKCNILHNAKK